LCFTRKIAFWGNLLGEAFDGVGDGGNEEGAMILQIVQIL